MIVTLILNNKKHKDYDLTRPADITQFKRIITLSIKEKNITRLTEAKKQLEKIENNQAAAQQLQRIQKFLVTIQKPNDLIQSQPIEPLSNEALKKEESPPIEQTILFTEAAEDGETSFQSLYAYLLQDMAKYTGNIDHLAWYSAIVLNMFMHAATYTPVEGHGKSQHREYKNKSQLQYYRSYGKHPMVKLVAPLVEVRTQTCRLPFNKGFIKLLPTLNESLSKEFAKFNEWGIPTEKVSSYVITRIAHTGARRNNFSVLVDALTKSMEHPTSEHDKFYTKLHDSLVRVLPCTSKIAKLPLETLTSRILDLLKRFKQTAPLETVPKLAGSLLDYRIKRVVSLQKKIAEANLKHLKLDTSHENLTCLLIRLYPNCKKNNGDYKVGVTNVLLSFLAGLINHHAQEKGLMLHAERRQSFGFLRPTLTDAGNLTIRLSLGVETSTFDEIVLQSLRELDVLLEKYNFETRNPELVKNVFQIAKGNKRNSYIRTAVTKDDSTYKTFHQAMAYLQEAKKINNENYLEKALENFLQNYVVEGKSLPIDRSLTLNPVMQVCDSKVVDLLKNVLAYAVQFASQLEFLVENEPLTPFAHSYWHSLLKLHNSCEEARYLLNQLEKIEATEFYSKATLLTENILEYLISLDSLSQIRQQLEGKPSDPVEKLRETEANYLSASLSVPKENIAVYFTDNGQQAITTSLLVMSQMLHGAAADGKTYDRDVYLFGHSYFEVGDFMKDIKSSLEIGRLEAAKIVFVDVSELNLLDLEKCNAMKALVIDTTHHPIFDLPELKEIIIKASENGIWVLVVRSEIKHGQLGLDKYQAGSISIVTPPGKILDEHTVDLFRTVSEEAIHPAAASYLQMVQEICHEKVESPTVTSTQTTVELNSKTALNSTRQQREKVSTQALLARGFGLAAQTTQLNPLTIEISNKATPKVAI